MTDTTATERNSGASTPASRRVSPWWRVLAALLLVVLLLGWATSTSMVEQLKAQLGQQQARLAQVPQVREIAVLLDQQQLPAMLITHDPQQGALLLQRLSEVREGRQDSMQLWALGGDAKPRSLGVIQSKFKTLQMPITEAALQGVTQLAISVENKDGVPEPVGPSLPYLFQGWLVKKSI
jgi:anti-sigma-K factor RskA